MGITTSVTARTENNRDQTAVDVSRNTENNIPQATKNIAKETVEEVSQHSSQNTALEITTITTKGENEHFSPKEWLEEQCKSLMENLDENNLANAAQEFKESVLENLTALEENIAEDLKKDFKLNAELIKKYFNCKDKKLDSKEIDFLQAYIKFLGACLKIDDNDLKSTLNNINQSFSDLINQIKRINNNNNLEQSDSSTHSGENSNNEDSIEKDIRTLKNFTDHIKQKEEVSRSHFDNDDHISVTTLHTNDNYETDGDVYFDDDAVQEQESSGHNETSSKNTEESDRKELIEPNDTALTKEAETVNHGAYETELDEVKTSNLGAYETEFNEVVDNLERQIQTLTKLTRLNKNSDGDFIKILNFIENNCQTIVGQNINESKLNAQPENFHHPVYTRAIEILDKLQDENIDEIDKKLAKIVVGAWIVAQTLRLERTSLRQSFNKSINGTSVEAKSIIVLDLAGHLLSTRTNDTIKNNELLSKYIQKNYKADKQGESEDSISDADKKSTTDNTKLKEQLLEIAKDKIQNFTDTNALDLIKIATGNRTYKKDLVAASGHSRQTIFKESMLRVIELIKPTGDYKKEDLNTRMYNASIAINDITSNEPKPDFIKLLGLVEKNDKFLESQLLDQLVMASVAHNDLFVRGEIYKERSRPENKPTKSIPDFIKQFVESVQTSEQNTEVKKHERKSRGSLRNHIEKYEQRPQLESMKNHNLHGFDKLSDILIDFAMTIRPSVITKIDSMIEDLNPEVSADKEPSEIKISDIQNLVKLIIVTIDAESSRNNDFDLTELCSTAKDFSADKPEKFIAALEKIQEVLGTKNGSLNKSDWLLDDQRSTLTKTLKSNPLKSVPFLNRIPLLPKITAAAYNIAKSLIIGSAGGAVAIGASAIGGAVALGAGVLVVAGLIGGAVVAVPAYGAYQALKRSL